MQAQPVLCIDPMCEADVPTVYEIDREVFTTPWPRSTYYSEIAARGRARYLVLRQVGQIVAYGGLWKLYDEAHVTTIGVAARFQQRGFGRIMFAALVQAAYEMGAKWITLEVRVSNDTAIRLYESFGFQVIGRRPRYYTDVGEDALVMWSDAIISERFRSRYRDSLAKITGPVAGLETSVRELR